MPFNANIYAADRPDLMNNWQAAHAPGADLNDPVVQHIRSFPTPQAYMEADYNANPLNQAQRGGVGGGAANVPPPAPNVGTATVPTQTAGAAGTTTGGATGGAATGGGGFNFNDLLSDDNIGAVTGAIDNYRQRQSGNQSGAFNTTGQTNVGTNTTSGTSGVNTTSGTNTALNTTNTSGTNTSNTTTGGTANTTTGGTVRENTGGTSATTGGFTNRPVDTLGFGSLLQGAAPGVQANDATRSAFLTDVVNTGESQLGSQVDQAVRQSLSGPGMTGTGESAQGRAAGYAAAQIARNNLGQRLEASQQLGGPTGLQHLVTAGNPYLGQTGTSSSNQATTGTLSGSNTGTSNTTNTGTSNTAGSNTGSSTGRSDATNTGRSTSDQTGFNNLLSSTNEATGGTATGSSSASASGMIPKAETVNTGGGGCIICTAGLHHGFFRYPRVLRRVVRHKLQTDRSRWRRAARGYFFLFTPTARFCLDHRWASALTMPLARAVVYEELRISGRCVPFKVVPWVTHWLCHSICALAGRLSVPEDVRDKALLETARRHNVLFNVGG